MGSKKVQSSVSFSMMLFMVLMINSQVVNGAVSCGDAVSDLVPCGSYLMGSGTNSSPTKECCDGARKLNQFATTTADRQSLCACLKQTGPSFGVQEDKAKQLPVLCKLKLNIPISPNVDCSKVQ